MEQKKNDAVSCLLKNSLLKPCKLNAAHKPLVAVVNSYMGLSPGDAHFRELAEDVRRGIVEGGGIPVDVNIPGFCGELKKNPYVRKYFFAYRDFATAMVEFMLAFHDFEGAVFLCTCDNQVPAFVMGALRVDLPCVFLTGGYMAPGKYRGEKITAFSVAKHYGKVLTGEMTEEELAEMVERACPTCGACAELGTANTMCALTEAMGLSLPGCATVQAQSEEQKTFAAETGRAVMDCIRNHRTPRSLVTKETLENAVRVCMAIGGSTNAIIHLIAYAKEIGADISLDTWDAFSRNTPLVLAISPNQPGYYMDDLQKNGGMRAVLKVLEPLLHGQCRNVQGISLRELLKEVCPRYSAILRPLEDPFSKTGGLAILKGNLASRGAVIKTSAIPKELQYFAGRAQVFECEEDAMQGVLNGQVQKGDVVVVRYEGPSGGCGSREVVSILHLLVGKGWQNDVAVITDGRLSGTNLGLAVCNASPEAIHGTALSVVENGDPIVIDVANRRLFLDLPEASIQQRLEKWVRPQKKVKSGILSLYADVVGPLSDGARII